MAVDSAVLVTGELLLYRFDPALKEGFDLGAASETPELTAWRRTIASIDSPAQSVETRAVRIVLQIGRHDLLECIDPREEVFLGEASLEERAGPCRP